MNRSEFGLESCRAGANPEKAHSTPSPGIDRQGVYWLASSP